MSAAPITIAPLDIAEHLVYQYEHFLDAYAELALDSRVFSFHIIALDDVCARGTETLLRGYLGSPWIGGFVHIRLLIDPRHRETLFSIYGKEIRRKRRSAKMMI